jgi:hypothetical protein
VGAFDQTVVSGQVAAVRIPTVCFLGACEKMPEFVLPRIEIGIRFEAKTKYARVFRHSPAHAPDGYPGCWIPLVTENDRPERIHYATTQFCSSCVLLCNQHIIE